MNDAAFDLAIIGAGPGGYVTAIRAAHRGLRVALVEERECGGVCLQAGCIPTKTMIAAAGLWQRIRGAGDLGLQAQPATPNLPAIVARRQRVVRQLTQGVEYLLDKNRVRLMRGRGVLASAREITVEDAQGHPIDSIHEPRAIVLATGSRPAELPMARRDGIAILNSRDMLALEEPPPELLIIGGGYIGCEFASLFASLGSRVTLIEALPRLLPNLDAELGQGLERAFKKAGIQVILNAQVQKVEAADTVNVALADGRILAGTKLLVSVGRIPNTERLGLEKAGVKLDGRFIGINERMETNVPGIYAIGDVTGKLALAHVASAQGRIVLDQLATQPGQDKTPAAGGTGPSGLDYDTVPACVFTRPEVATVGLTDAEAVRRGWTVRVGRFPFLASGKALADGETEGFVKLVADAATGRLLGGQVLGAHAAELIGPIALAVQLGATARQLSQTVFAHPTLNEVLIEAAEDIIGKPTHVISRP